MTSQHLAMNTNNWEYRRAIESLKPTDEQPVEESDPKQRKQAKALIASALKIITNLEKQHGIPSSETCKALAKLHQKNGNYNASQHFYYASKQMQKDERR